MRVRLLEAPLQALPNVVEKNAFSFFTLASGVDNLPDFEAFLCPSTWAPSSASRSAYGLRRPPAAAAALDPSHAPEAESGPHAPHQTPKETTAGLICKRMIAVPCEANLKMDHDGTIELKFR